MPSALLHESRDIQWPLKVRMGATVAALLTAHKPDTIDKGQYLIQAGVDILIVRLVLAGELRRAHHVLTTLLASDLEPEVSTAEAGDGFPAGKRVGR